MDAIAWTSTTVFLLRGRPGGGMAWGGAFEADGLSIAGADARDLSGDNLPDVAIAWVDGAGVGTLDVWEGDGLFGFTAAEPLTTPGTPTGLVIGDDTGEGLAQITVLQADGDWARYIRGSDLRYMPIGPRAPTEMVVLPVGAEILPAGDINDDGGQEIALATPRAPGVGRAFWFVDVATDEAGCEAGDPEAQCGTEYLPLQNESGAFYASGDGNGDYLDDVFFLDDDRAVYAVMWDPLHVDGNYAKAHPIDVPSYAPFDVNDLDLDGELDLVLAAGPLWWTWHGHGYHDTETFWGPREVPSVFVREALVGRFALAEVDGDPATIEALGFFDDAGQTDFRVYQYTPGLGRAVQLGHLNVGSVGQSPDDLAVCGSDVYVAVGGAVDRISLDDPTHPTVAASLGGSATRIDCGVGPSNSQLAVLDSGLVTFHTRSALARVGEEVTATGAVDLALGDLGAGPEVRTCDEPGCSVAFWPVGYFAATDSLGTTLSGTDGDHRVPGTGLLSVGDPDGDGVTELFSLDPATGLVAVHRVAGGSVAPPALYRLDAGSTGPLIVLDADRDGIADLWFVNPDGELTVTTSAPPITTAP
jgi:hypothetical protein